MRSRKMYARWWALMGAIGAVLAGPAHAGIFGAPKFTVTQSDDRFSADGRTTWSSEGNRISKRSIAGGSHIDGKGVFLNPAAAVNRTTGKLELLTLTFINLAERMGGLSTPNGLGRPRRVSFVTGEGAPIVLAITDAEQRYGEASCSQYAASCTTPLVESGIAVITPDQYRRIIGARALAIKIDGTDRSRVYEARDIGRSFIPNLAAFYAAHIANAL